jgi:hypothetical protein
MSFYARPAPLPIVILSCFKPLDWRGLLNSCSTVSARGTWTSCAYRAGSTMRAFTVPGK